MATLRITNILLLLIAALLGVHIALQTFRPVGRYEWVGNSGILDTRTGVIYTDKTDYDLPHHTVKHETMQEIPAPK
jgi:hypothetical protein